MFNKAITYLLTYQSPNMLPPAYIPPLRVGYIRFEYAWPSQFAAFRVVTPPSNINNSTFPSVSLHQWRYCKSVISCTSNFKREKMSFELFSKNSWRTDSVSHLKLVHKLSGYGIHGNLLSWISYFPSNRTQRVRVGSSLSYPCTNLVVVANVQIVLYNFWKERVLLRSF